MLKKQYLKAKPICKVTFILPREAAPEAEEIRLLGDFNAWSWENGIPMKLNGEEYRTTVELETGRHYEFRYLVDGHSWVNDWDADDYVPSPFHGIDNSVIHIEAQSAPAPRKPAKAAPKKPVASKTSRPKAPKKAAAAPKAPARKDDLKKIEGIGPKIEGLLNQAGIETFEHLSKAKADKLKSVLQAAGPRYKMHDPATWTRQAKMAAQGAWDELATLQKELKGGRKK